MAKKEKNIVRRRLLRSYLTSMISISLVLTLVGASTIFGASASNVAAYFKENMAVSLILKQHIDEEQAVFFADSLSGAEHIRSAEFISREQGAEELKSLLGDDFLSVFESTPVPASVELHLEGDMIAKDSLAMLQKHFLEDERVEEVVYQESIVETLNANISRITRILFIVIILLLIMSFALINNTVRLNIYARRFTIHTMRLVGAKRSFIARPFMNQAIIQGAVSGVVACAILYTAISYVRTSSELLYSLFNMTLVYGVFAGIVLLGILICSLSALFVTRRIAIASKDDLYY